MAVFIVGGLLCALFAFVVLADRSRASRNRGQQGGRASTVALPADLDSWRGPPLAQPACPASRSCPTLVDMNHCFTGKSSRSSPKKQAAQRIWDTTCFSEEVANPVPRFLAGENR